MRSAGLCHLGCTTQRDGPLGFAQVLPLGLTTAKSPCDMVRSINFRGGVVSSPLQARAFVRFVRVPHSSAARPIAQLFLAQATPSPISAYGSAPVSPVTPERRIASGVCTPSSPPDCVGAPAKHDSRVDMNDYTLLKVLGKGSFGKVCSGFG